MHVLNRADGGGGKDRKFGTIEGVFVPTVLTIMGAIMYLRLGWVVGNAGLVGSILIILLAHVITVSTGLAVSSIATNIRVGEGGAFSIISQSLGLEVGGSISVPLYLAQAISTTLYIFAFTEGWQRIFPGSSTVLVALVTLGVVFLIAYISARLAARIQILILAVVGFSLFSVILSRISLAGPVSPAQSPELWGPFRDGSFWGIFAVFFPAVTGIMAGINLSGNLRDPRQSIPKGTMGAIGITLFVYLVLAYWFTRVATVEELLTNTTVMVDKAFFDWAILAGLLGATFSSALGSLLAAPRVMQALGRHGVVPFGSALAKERDGEPRRAMAATGVLVLLTTLAALSSENGLNAIAPLITMFFLITYFMLNAVVLIEQRLDLVSFRPTFAIPQLVPLIGLAGCLFVMILVNPIFSLVAMILTLGIYGYLLRRQLNAPWEDVRSGLFLSLAHWAVRRISRLPQSPERTWSPNVLAPVSSARALMGSYRFLRAIAMPQGAIHILGIFAPGQNQGISELESIAHAFNEDGLGGRVTLLEEENFVAGTRTAMQILSTVFFRPNILFLPLIPENQGYDLLELLKQTNHHKMGIVLFARNKVVELGREQLINVWIRGQGPEWRLGLRLANLDLAVLLAYQLARNWNGRVSLCMVVSDEEEKVQAEKYLSELMSLARLPDSTRATVFMGTFWDSLVKAESADLSIFGLQPEPDLDFASKVAGVLDASCMFVRDSGDESALA